ncbi:hypothetical protein [Micromonospora sp. ALFpr18c]|uniref:hypothetical protein n=1 Tax=Micromonospora sp. ALFpr18c TaxID=1458665 RepID=UPI00351A8FA3
MRPLTRLLRIPRRRTSAIVQFLSRQKPHDTALRRPKLQDRRGGWEVVTVDRPPEQVLPGGRWPEPLRRLDGAVEVRVRTAPGDRGTELAARPLAGASPAVGLAAHLVGDDPRLLVRRTLRQVKQRVETGEVLRADRSALDRPEARG